MRRHIVLLLCIGLSTSAFAATEAPSFDLLKAMSADKALRTWMDMFLEYMTTKRGMSDALRLVIASGGNPFAESRARLLGAFTALMKAGAAEGTLRDDLDPADLLASVSGVSLAVTEPGQREQAGRLLDLLMDGLRYRAAATRDG